MAKAEHVKSMIDHLPTITHSLLRILKKHGFLIMLGGSGLHRKNKIEDEIFQMAPPFK